MFTADPTLEMPGCHQSLLHGMFNVNFTLAKLFSYSQYLSQFCNATNCFLAGQSTSVLSVEPEYSLPQNSIQGLDASSVDRLRRGPPEPYASSAIYTELNFKVCTDNNHGKVEIRLLIGFAPLSITYRILEMSNCVTIKFNFPCRTATTWAIPETVQKDDLIIIVL